MIRLLFRVFLAFTTIGTIALPTKAQNPYSCPTGNSITAYELVDKWIYICQDAKSIYYLQIDNNNTNSLQLKAQGDLYTYAAFQGELTEPDSIIYNISPFVFKMIQSTAIIHQEKVLNTWDIRTGTQINQLSGEVAQKSQGICGKNTPIKTSETDNKWIYLCIDNSKNLEAINLTYIEVQKNNSEKLSPKTAQFDEGGNFRVQKDSSNYLIITNVALETWQQGKKLSSEPITHVYLKAAE